ncbi:hypothetical protein Tco_0851390 [Tanacetum coccineum]
MLHDLPYKINQTINEAVKGVVQIALQAPLRERFRDLSEADMKEILYDWMFESGSYRSHPEHDDQDPPSPPTKESEQSKKKKHDSDASGSKQTPAQTSSAWKTSDIREAPSSSSKQKTAPQSEQQTKSDWLKPVPEEDKLETPELDWVIPPNDLPEPENNWANAFATSKSKLSKADLEGLAYKIDLVNPKGHRVVHDVSKPLPLGGPPSQTKLNLTELNWDAFYFLFKEDYTIVSKPRAVIYIDRNDQKKMMRETEVHKFSDGTLTRILRKADHMSLESFTSERLRDVDYRLIQRTE